MLAVGGNWLLAELGLFPFGWPGLLAAGLMTLGIAMIGTAKAGRTKPLVALGILMTFFLAMSSGVAGGFHGPVVGDQMHRITTVEELRRTYENGLGDMTLDLTRLELDTPREVSVSARVGDVEVVLPEGMPVRIEARIAGPGDIKLFGLEREGLGGSDLAYASPDFVEVADRLVLRLETGVGDITVERG